MSSSQISKRYAQAFYSHLSQEARKQALADFKSLLHTLEVVPALASFLSNPVVPVERKARFLRQAFSDRLIPSTLTFMQFLLHKGRLAYLRPIAAAYLELEERQLKRYTAKLTAKLALGENFKTQLVKRLEAQLQAEVRLKEIIDPTLLGGFKLQLGDVLYDYTLNDKLKRLEQKLCRA